MTGTGANGYRVRQADYSPAGYVAYMRERLAASPRTHAVLTAIELLCLMSGPPIATEIAEASGTSISDSRRLTSDAMRAGLVDRERVRRPHVAATTPLYGYRLTAAGRQFITERESHP